MADTATTSVGMRKQSIGSNTNTWGDTKLNVDLDQADRAIAGYDAITLTGDTTWTWTSYTSNAGQVPNVVLNGSLSSAAALTVPSVPWNWDSVTNNTGVQITMKTSGGTGVAIPNGVKAAVYNNGTDCVFAAPTFVGTGYTVSQSGSVANKTYVDTAIATAVIPAAAGTVLVSGSDTTASYLLAAFTTPASSGIAFTLANAGGNEQVAVTMDVNAQLTASTNVVSTDKFPFYDATAAAMRSQTRALVVGKYGLILQSDQVTGFTVAAGNLYPCDYTSAGFLITGPASASRGDVFGIAAFGTNTGTFSTNSLLYYGVAYTALPVTEGVQFFYYTGASRGWIDA